MDIRKNLIIDNMLIDGMTSEGNGVGRADGMAVFVPFTAVGDIIRCRIAKVCRSYAYGIIEEMISPSADRISDSGCAVFPRCGGCTFRHIGYEAELKIKDNFVRDAFRRIGGTEPEFEDILGCETPSRYRNKAQYPLAYAGGKAVCGFYAPRSHRVTACTDCDLQPVIFSEIVTFVLEYINSRGIKVYDEKTGGGNVRHIYLRRGEHTSETMLCIIAAKKDTLPFEELGDRIRKKFPEIKSVVLNHNPEKTNVILGKKNYLISGKDHITDIMCGNIIKISPLSFYQVNTVQAEKLYAIAGEYAGFSGNEHLLDLYCGAGTVGLSFAKKIKKLTGCELIPEAVENARENARINGTDNAEFFCGDADEVSQMLAAKNLSPDIIITDPPRKGCGIKTLEAAASMSPEKIVMISCNPATAARDAAALEKLGYKTVRVRAVDLFPRTAHVETVVLMSRVKE